MAATANAAKVLEAARKRLATAKLHSSSAAEALESAKGTEDAAKQTATKIAEEARKMVEMAKMTVDSATTSRKIIHSQYEDSKKEVTEAKAFLKEAEERCEVVDVSSGDESDENESRKKQKTGVVEKIMVEGCGVPEVNGTYKRSDKLYCGVHTYRKKGPPWKGEKAKYRIFYESCLNGWYINIVGIHSLYFAPATTGEFAEVPPENGWKVCHRGRDPAPRLKLS